MNKILEFINKSRYKDYYLLEVENFSKNEKIKLEELIIKLENAGATEPLEWAFSEIKEGIPQFSRFLILNNLFKIINNINENMSLFEDFTENMDDINLIISKIKKNITDEELKKFLKLYGKIITWNIIQLIDEGNPNYKSDGITWSLMKVDSSLNNTNQVISGLHEDFQEFENH